MDITVFLVLRYFLGGYKTATISAMQKAAENLRVLFCFLASTANFYSVLHFIKKRFGNNRRMIALVYFTAIAEIPVVKRVGENTLNMVV